MSEYIELNMQNYDEDQVAQLNAWAIDASLEMDTLEAKNADLIALLRECGEWIELWGEHLPDSSGVVGVLTKRIEAALESEVDDAT